MYLYNIWFYFGGGQLLTVISRITIGCAWGAYEIRISHLQAGTLSNLCNIFIAGTLSTLYTISFSDILIDLIHEFCLWCNKMDRRPKHIVPQRRHDTTQKAHENQLKVTCLWGKSKLKQQLNTTSHQWE